jgi:hypothetical protein
MSNTQAGKGDKWRKTNFKQFYGRFDSIDWAKPKKKPISQPERQK